MKKRLLAAALACLLLTPSISQARHTEEEKEVVDARLEGYEKGSLQLPSSSTALTWLLLIVLSGMTVGVMFKDAKRSYLD